jgi:hypothetical protein
MSIALEVTVKTRAARDDNQDQEIETVITLNWDHVTSVAPRVNGGSIISLANGNSLICRETRADINTQIANGGLMFVIERETARQKVKTDLKPIKPRKKKSKARA